MTTNDPFNHMTTSELPVCERINFHTGAEVPSLFEIFHGNPDVVMHTETTIEDDGRTVFHIIAFHIKGRMILTQADDQGLQLPYRMNLPYANRNQSGLFDWWWHYETMSRTNKGRNRLTLLTNERTN